MDCCAVVQTGNSYWEQYFDGRTLDLEGPQMEFQIEPWVIRLRKYRQSQEAEIYLDGLSRGSKRKIEETGGGWDHVRSTAETFEIKNAKLSGDRIQSGHETKLKGASVRDCNE